MDGGGRASPSQLGRRRTRRSDSPAKAGDGAEAVKISRRARPDVALMDIRMPRMDGIEATKRLTAPGGEAAPGGQVAPGTGAPPGAEVPPRVVILTTYDLDEYVFNALAAGASGFLLKDVPLEDLVKAVRVAGKGEALLAPSVTRRLIEQSAPHAHAPRSAPLP